MNNRMAAASISSSSSSYSSNTNINHNDRSRLLPSIVSSSSSSSSFSSPPSIVDIATIIPPPSRLQRMSAPRSRSPSSLSSQSSSSSPDDRNMNHPLANNRAHDDRNNHNNVIRDHTRDDEYDSINTIPNRSTSPLLPLHHSSSPPPMPDIIVRRTRFSSLSPHRHANDRRTLSDATPAMTIISTTSPPPPPLTKMISSAPTLKRDTSIAMQQPNMNRLPSMHPALSRIGSTTTANSITTSAQPSSSSSPASSNPSPPSLPFFTRVSSFRLGYSLFLFHVDSPFRRLMHSLVHSTGFNLLIVLAILFNVAVLALDKSYGVGALIGSQTEAACTSLFLAEFACKVIALGFVLDGAKSYLRNRWNQLDFLILVASTSVLFFADDASEVFRVANVIVRVLRVLRPVAQLTRRRELRRLRAAITKAAGPLGTAMGLLGLFFLLFALVSVSVFQNKLGWVCVWDSDPLRARLNIPEHCGAASYNCGPNAHCANLRANPSGGMASFDNVPIALMTLFSITTLSKWSSIMYAAMDSTHWSAAFFFVFVVVANAFFVMNLAFAIIRTGFEGAEMVVEEENRERKRRKKRKEKEKEKGKIESDTKSNTVAKTIDKPANDSDDDEVDHAELDSEDRLLADRSNLARLERARLRRNRHRQPGTSEEPPPAREQHWYRIGWLHNDWIETHVRKHVVNLSASTGFNVLFFGVTVANIALLASEYDGQPEFWTAFLSRANVALTALFALELLVKWTGSGFVYYWIESTLNILDLSVVLVGVLEFLLADSSSLDIIKIVRVLRMLRIVRVLKVVGRMESLSKLVEVVATSMKEVAYTGLFLLLFMVMYATTGMFLFADGYAYFDLVTGELDSSGNGLGAAPRIPRLNFSDFGHAIFLCFHLLTLDAWCNLMYTAVANTTWAAAAYFISWIILGVYLCLNMIVAVIVTSFEVEQTKIYERKMKLAKRKRLFRMYKKKYEHQNGIRMQLVQQQSKDVNESTTNSDGGCVVNINPDILLPSSSPLASPSSAPPLLLSKRSFNPLRPGNGTMVPQSDSERAAKPGGGLMSKLISSMRAAAESRAEDAEHEQALEGMKLPGSAARARKRRKQKERDKLRTKSSKNSKSHTPMPIAKEKDKEKPIAKERLEKKASIVRIHSAPSVLSITRSDDGDDDGNIEMVTVSSIMPSHDSDGVINDMHLLSSPNASMDEMTSPISVEYSATAPLLSVDMSPGVVASPSAHFYHPSPLLIPTPSFIPFTPLPSIVAAPLFSSVSTNTSPSSQFQHTAAQLLSRYSESPLRPRPPSSPKPRPKKSTEKQGWIASSTSTLTVPPPIEGIAITENDTYDGDEEIDDDADDDEYDDEDADDDDDDEGEKDESNTINTIIDSPLPPSSSFSPRLDASLDFSLSPSFPLLASPLHTPPARRVFDFSSSSSQYDANRGPAVAKHNIYHRILPIPRPGVSAKVIAFVAAQRSKISLLPPPSPVLSSSPSVIADHSCRSLSRLPSIPSLLLLPSVPFRSISSPSSSRQSSDGLLVVGFARSPRSAFQSAAAAHNRTASSGNARIGVGRTMKIDVTRATSLADRTTAAVMTTNSKTNAALPPPPPAVPPHIPPPPSSLSTPDRSSRTTPLAFLRPALLRPASIDALGRSTSSNRNSGNQTPVSPGDARMDVLNAMMRQPTLMRTGSNRNVAFLVDNDTGNQHPAIPSSSTTTTVLPTIYSPASLNRKHSKSAFDFSTGNDPELSMIFTTSSASAIHLFDNNSSTGSSRASSTPTSESIAAAASAYAAIDAADDILYAALDASSDEDKPEWQIELEVEIKADEEKARIAALPPVPPLALFRILSLRMAVAYVEPRRPVSYVPFSYYTDHFLAKHEWFRMLSHAVFHRRFEYVILCFVVASAGSLTIENHNLDESQGLGKVIVLMDYAYTGIFITEMLLKMLCMGIIGLPDAYLSNGWNRLDFIIVVTNILNLTVDLGSFTAIRALRVLRPLRLIDRNEGMRAVVTTVVACVLPMANVIILLFLAYLTFGIIAVKLWSGKLGFCQLDPNVAASSYAATNITASYLYTLDKAECLLVAASSIFAPSNSTLNFTAKVIIGNFTSNATSTLVTLAVWSPPRKNFDNILNAMQSLYSISTLQNWNALAFSTMDSTGSTSAPALDACPLCALFFVVYIFLVCWILNGLFVGVVFDTFVGLRNESAGLGLLSDAQRRWIQGTLALLEAEPPGLPRPAYGSKLRTRVFQLVYGAHAAKFDFLVTSAVVVNVAIMGVTYVGEPRWIVLGREYANIVFFGLYFLEMSLKVVALGFAGYFADAWNKFDGFIVGASGCEVALTLLWPGNLGGLVMVLQLFRIFRLFRVVKELDRVQVLLRSLVLSLPRIANVAFLMLFIFFVFAVVAVQLFGRIDQGECIDSHANFADFATSMLTLFRISTGQDWDCFMYDCMDVSNGGTSIALVFFTAFILSVNFVCLSLFIAVLLDNLSLALRHAAVAAARRHRRENMHEFREVQQEVEMEARGDELIKQQQVKNEQYAELQKKEAKEREKKKRKERRKANGIDTVKSGAAASAFNYVPSSKAASTLSPPGLAHPSSTELSPMNSSSLRRHLQVAQYRISIQLAAHDDKLREMKRMHSMKDNDDGTRGEANVASTSEDGINASSPIQPHRLKTDRELLASLQLTIADPAFLSTLIGEYTVVWSALDPSSTRFVPLVRLPDLLRRLDTPLGVGPRASLYKMIVRCAGVTIRKHRFPPATQFVRCVQFTELLHGLLHYLFGAELPEASENDVTNKVKRELEGKVGVNVEEVMEREPLSTVGVWLACQAMEDLWSNYLKRRRDRVAAAAAAATNIIKDK